MSFFWRHLSTYRHALCLLVLTAIVLLPIIAVQNRPVSVETKPQRPPEQILRPVYFSQINLLVGRTELSCATGPCVLLHFGRVKNFSKTYDSNQILLGDPNDPSDDGFRFEQPGNVWSDAAISHPTTFNCCTFAVGDQIGLTPLDWVRPNATEETKHVNPMAVILASYFDLILTFRSDPIKQAKSTKLIREGDVVCFVKCDPTLEFVHAGRIQKHKSGANWMVSKFGDSDILVTPLQASARVWPEFDEIRIYRPKSDRFEL